MTLVNTPLPPPRARRRARPSSPRCVLLTARRARAVGARAPRRTSAGCGPRPAGTLGRDLAAAGRGAPRAGCLRSARRAGGRVPAARAGDRRRRLLPARRALLRGVLAREPRNADALVALGGLALSRHDFRGGLRLARRSQAGLAALPVTVDALVELGRYGDARRALQRLADLKPNLSTYARVSYLRELHGDLGGAASALDLAAAAGGPAPENAAAIEVLRGDLALVRGRPAEARAAYGARAGRGAEVRAGGGRPRAAGGIRRPTSAAPRPRRGSSGRPTVGRRVAASAGPSASIEASSRGCRCPSTPSASARPSWRPGACGRRGRTSRSCACSSGCSRAPGSTRTRSSRCSRATTGGRARGLRLARRAWAAAPSVRSADAVGWALTRSGRRMTGCAGRGARGGSGRPIRCSRSTPGWPRAAPSGGGCCASRSRTASARGRGRRCRHGRRCDEARPADPRRWRSRRSPRPRARTRWATSP